MKANIENLLKELNTAINAALADESVSHEVCAMLINQRKELEKNNEANKMKDKQDNKTIDAFERQPMSPAERKRKQREKMRSEKSRLDCYISNKHKKMLDELRENLSIDAMLEKLIEDEHRELVDTMTHNTD